MIRLLFDENFDHDILRGLQLRMPDLNAVTVQSVRLQGASDAELLSWAAAQGLILVTHDLNTVPKFAYQRLKAGESIAGVFVVPSSLPIGEAIEQLRLSSLAAWNTNGRIELSTCQFNEEPTSTPTIFLDKLIVAACPIEIDYVHLPLIPTTGSHDEFVL